MNDLSLKLTPATDWCTMSPDEQNRALFQKKKKTCSTRSCPTGAIDRRQYEKSLTCMAEKMGIDLDKDD